MTSLEADLVRALGAGGVLTGDAVGEAYSRDWSGESAHKPAMVLRPTTTAEVSAALRLCWERGQPIVAQGGRTGLVAGALPHEGEVVLSTERMNTIEELDTTAATLTVQAGVCLQTAQEAAEAEGLILALDLGSRGSCTMGGVIATNAGGNRVIRYGMMRDLVIGVEAVLADGTVVNSLKKMLKDNAGYDIKQLFIGSEGTLGVVTRAVVKLHPKPITHNVAFCAVGSFDSVLALLELARSELGGALSAFEVMWDDYYDAVKEFAPGLRMPFESAAPFNVLVEAQGFDAGTDQDAFEAALATAMDRGLVSDAAVASSKAHVETFWKIRDAVSEVLVGLRPAFAYDVSMANSALQGFVDDARAEIAAQWPCARTLAFGHVGDGNVHLMVNLGPEGLEQHLALDEVVYRTTQRYSGSISGEHGIGAAKRDYLGFTRSPAEVAVMDAMKSALDPRGILAPGRVVPPLPVGAPKSGQ